MLHIVALAFCILVGYLYNAMKRDRQLMKSAESIPGPRGLPFLGNSLGLCFTKPHNIFRKLQQYRETYGSIFKLWVGKTLIIYVSEVDDLEIVFKSSKTLAQSELSKPFTYLDGLSRRATPMEERKVYQSAFVHKTLPFYTTFMNDGAGKLVETMKKLVDGPAFSAWEYLLPIYHQIFMKSVLGMESIPGDNVWQFESNVKFSFELWHHKLFRPWLQLESIYNFLFRQKIIKISQFMLTLTTQIVNLVNIAITREEKVDVDDDNLVSPQKLQSAIAQSIIGPVSLITLVGGVLFHQRWQSNVFFWLLPRILTFRRSRFLVMILFSCRSLSWR